MAGAVKYLKQEIDHLESSIEYIFNKLNILDKEQDSFQKDYDDSLVQSEVLSESILEQENNFYLKKELQLNAIRSKNKAQAFQD